MARDGDSRISTYVGYDSAWSRAGSFEHSALRAVGGRTRPRRYIELMTSRRLTVTGDPRTDMPAAFAAIRGELKVPDLLPVQPERGPAQIAARAGWCARTPPQDHHGHTSVAAVHANITARLRQLVDGFALVVRAHEQVAG